MGAAAEESFGEASADFRAHIPDLKQSRFQIMRDQNADEYARAFFEKQNPPWLYDLVQTWKRLYKEPFQGITADGHVVPNLFPHQDEGVEMDKIVSAANDLLSQISPVERDILHYPLSAPERRAWSNPEILISPYGLRLESLSPDLRSSILAILQATLSPEGYTKAVSAMRINHFLGSVVQAPKIMNEFSYNFLLFGAPSTTEPWAWSFYGHHLCLNVFLWGGQMVISPTFTAAEPNLIDEGPYAGTRILHEEERLGLDLMQDLPPHLQRKAQIYKQMHDPAMPADRWNKDDQRHLCGAFRDNRTVPYEGILVSDMTASQRALILAICTQYLLYLPSQSRATRIEQIKSHFPSTYFSWIGGYGPVDPFYYRIQSPVVVIEFDHHSGVFLANAEPAKFHIHTILRTPNAGDYGHALSWPKERKL